MHARPSIFLALCWLAACGGNGAPALDAATDSALPGLEVGPEAGASAGVFPRDDEAPITTRPSRSTYQCRVQRDRTDHRPRSWSLVPPALVATAGGAAFLARFEATIPSLPPSPAFPAATQFLVSSFDLAGTFGAPLTLAQGDAWDRSAVTAAPRGDGFLAVWNVGSTFRGAAFDASGKAVLGPRDLLTDASTPGNSDRQLFALDPRLARGPDGGFGLIYTPQASAGSYEVRFTVLDPDGGVRMPPRALTPMPGSTFATPAPAIVGTPSGYAIVWRDPGDPAGGIDFAAADMNGAEVVARRRISPPAAEALLVGGVSMFEPPTNALVPVGDGYVAAWTEGGHGTFPGDLHDGGWVVRLARLDGAGNRVGVPVSLRKFQSDADEVEPTLIPFGDALAVLWAHGSHIYSCAGCVPDHRIDLLLVDPVTLTPVSNVVSVTNGGAPKAGGLLRRRVAVLGDSLLMTYLLTLHTYAIPGSAAFTCTKI
jgi:hypothetical protein